MHLTNATTDMLPVAQNTCIKLWYKLVQIFLIFNKFSLYSVMTLGQRQQRVYILTFLLLIQCNASNQQNKLCNFVCSVTKAHILRTADMADCLTTGTMFTFDEFTYVSIHRTRVAETLQGPIESSVVNALSVICLYNIGSFWTWFTS